MSEETKEENQVEAEQSTSKEEVKENTISKESVLRKIRNGLSQIITIASPITDRVRKIVLDFGEIILTVSIVIGLVSAIIDGLAVMGNVGFFSGLSSMFNNIVSIVMGALVIFLLFAIRKNTEK